MGKQSNNAEPNSADMVLTFRNLHSWKLPENQELAYEFVVWMAINAGFRLVATSEINANSKDSGLHPEGVWTLPPALRL